ncbi:hypothetical protein GGF32_006792 [Allomyces javanicus]|nr:hypothetical protein GGF32_006792 [Allomyces javanicus]
MSTTTRSMAPAPTSCVLDPAGLPPGQFINAAVVGQATVQAITSRTPRVYGCLQISNSQISKWWCATSDPSAEAASGGRDLGCSTSLNTTQSACLGQWTETLPAAASGAPQMLTVQGCLQDTKGFACSPANTARIECTPSKAAMTTSDSATVESSGGVSTIVIIGSTVGGVALLAIIGGLFFWNRKSKKDKNKAQDLYNPSQYTSQQAQEPPQGPPAPGPVARIPVLDQGPPPTPFANQPAAVATYPAQHAPVYVNPQHQVAYTNQQQPPQGFPAPPAAGQPYPIQQQPPQQQQQPHPAQQPQPAALQQSAPLQRSNGSLQIPGAAVAHPRQSPSPQQGGISQPPPSPSAVQSNSSMGTYHASPAVKSTSPMSQVSMASDEDLVAMGPPTPSFSFVAPRPSLSMETSLPALPATPRSSSGSPGSPYRNQTRASAASRPSGYAASVASNPSTNYSTDDEEFPRPYRTYINMEQAAPPVQAVALPGIVRDGAGEVAGPVVPALPSAIPSLSRARYAAPPDMVAEYFPLAFKLPLTAPMRTPRAIALCASKGHLPGYGIDEITSAFEGFMMTIREMVAQSFGHAAAMRAQMAASGQPVPPTLADSLFATVTHGAPPPAGSPDVGNQAAFLAQLMHTLLTDLFVALTSPLKVADHVAMIKKHLPDLKKDLKMPKAESHRGETDASYARLQLDASSGPAGTVSAHLLFVALDHMLSSPSLVTELMAHLRPILVHAATNLTNQFHSHGIPPPEQAAIDDMLAAFLDWFLRLKREFPGVGMYLVPEDAVPDPAFAVVEGGDPVAGAVVAFTTCYGLWDGAAGAVGYFARVWTKPPMI